MSPFPDRKDVEKSRFGYCFGMYTNPLDMLKIFRKLERRKERRGETVTPWTGSDALESIHAENEVLSAVCGIMGYKLLEFKDRLRLNVNYICEVHVTEKLKDAHPLGLVKENVGNMALAVVLLTTADGPYPSGYKTHVHERVRRVSSEIFGGRKGFWWEANQFLTRVDKLKLEVESDDEPSGSCADSDPEDVI